MRHLSPAGKLVAVIVGLLALGIFLMPSAKAAAPAAANTYGVPLFRHVVPDAPKPDLHNLGPVRFLADGDFPPFSFLDGKGTLAGFNVELADAVCRELRIACEFAVKPWKDIPDAIANGEADASIAGIRMTPQNAEKLDFTRAFYRPMARFAVRTQFRLKPPYVSTLAGKRIGVMAGSAHEAWLRAAFAHSNIRPFKTQVAAMEALRTGAIDAMFDDAVRLMFWIAGSEARHCCRVVKGAYVDEATFSPAMTIAVKRGNQKLLKALDYGLDQLQQNGTYAAIFRRYFPESPW